MRQYDIVSGIFLILSIIDFALAAPVLAQEKRQAGVDALHIPKDVIIVLGKRVDDKDLEKLLKGYIDSIGKPAESSDVHAPSSSAPPGPDHESTTDVVQAPVSNPASSTANPDSLIRPPGSSAVVPIQGDNEVHGILHAILSAGYDSGDELTAAHAPQPNPNIGPLTDGFDWDFWTKVVNSEPPRPAPAKWHQVEDVQQPNPGPLNPKPANEDLETWKPQILESSGIYPSSNPGPLNPKPANEDLETWKPQILESSGIYPSSNPGPLNPKPADEDLETWKPQILESSGIYPSSNPGPLNPKPADEDLETWKPHILESSGVYPSSNPASNPASSAASQGPHYPLMDSLGPSLAAPTQDEVDGHAVISAGYHDSDHGLTGVHAPQPNPNPNKRPLTGQDTDFDWDFWTKSVNSQPGAKRPKFENEVEHEHQPNAGPPPHIDWTNVLNPTPLSYAPPNEIGQTHKYEVTHVLAPQLSPGSSADSDFEYISLDDLPPLKPASPNEIGQAYRRPDPLAGPSTEPQHKVVNPPSPEDEEINQEPPPSPDPVFLGLGLQPLPAEYYSRPVDPQAVAYGLKGKKKMFESRRVSGTSRDVGNAAQREFRSAERSHDPGDSTARNPGNF